ncbi:coenzyme F420-0:L-glutamate ligase/coenzyme F420-1:gamma-L-glutamate ligase [Catenuloplanes nepalensis]|uniref:Coenzyme F420-0:L-glutamate ligase/coenzyme F420-1:gamma-L-glutamate ligase n=1 Tax=Catenuloplanes nepalensis TaxID=587533 RepID=A0ABT9N7V4_9ACTN|nr:coenzyme F420-0:L-glutamate ligase [Catenuloplanes nepalensis]MDP9799486.1 coenzyme F420-0:L-glutamate ligase/coenzyme F420-1:gamma-L-glutamate ligase [Catenuloplanes nepalensis]
MTDLLVLPVAGIGEIRPGDDLAAAIVEAAPWLQDDDVLVVTSKIVSKAEGRLVPVPAAEGPARDAAKDEILRGETARVVAARGQTRIVQTHHGFVMANAGIDASNVEPDRLVLLPVDPDASARALRAAVRGLTSRTVAVIISDTMGRTWRNGLTDVALGTAGLDPIDDHRGRTDSFGNELQVTQIAVADELAAAADLVKGKTGGVPVAVVRGYPHAVTDDDGPGAGMLVRDGASDMFSLGTAEARADGLRLAAGLPAGALFGPPVLSDTEDTAAVVRAIAHALPAAAKGTLFTHEKNPAAVRETPPPGVELPAATTDLIICSPPGESTAQLIRFGADVHRLRASLAAEGLASALLTDTPPLLLSIGPA